MCLVYSDEQNIAFLLFGLLLHGNLRRNQNLEGKEDGCLAFTLMKWVNTLLIANMTVMTICHFLIPTHPTKMDWGFFSHQYKWPKLYMIWDVISSECNARDKKWLDVNGKWLVFGKPHYAGRIGENNFYTWFWYHNRVKSNIFVDSIFYNMHRVPHTV